MGFFGIFSKTSLRILLVFTEKEGLIVIHTCTKFHVQENSGSRDIGQKGVRIGVFQHLLKKYHFDLVHSSRQQRSNSITCACKVSIPHLFLFSRYELLFELKITKSSKCSNFVCIGATELRQCSIDRKFPADSKNAIILKEILNGS